MKLIRIFILWLIPVTMYCCSSSKPSSNYDLSIQQIELSLPNSQVKNSLFSEEYFANEILSEREIFHNGAEFIKPLFFKMYLEKGDTLYIIGSGNIVREIWTHEGSKGMCPDGIPGDRIIIRLRSQVHSQSQVLLRSYIVGTIGG